MRSKIKSIPSTRRSTVMKTSEWILLLMLTLKIVIILLHVIVRHLTRKDKTDGESKSSQMEG